MEPLQEGQVLKNHRNAKSGDHQERIHAIFLPSCANFWLWMCTASVALVMFGMYPKIATFDKSAHLYAPRNGPNENSEINIPKNDGIAFCFKCLQLLDGF